MEANNYGLREGFLEFDYLSSIERGSYYRNITRIMYLELEKKEYLFSHEIAEKMEKIDSNYTEETCNKDLEFLFKKGNVIKYKNDYSQIKTLEELKKKKYRYQLTDRGRMIEEFLIEKLNQANTLSTTLDPNLLTRFKEELKDIVGVKDEAELHSRWNNIIYAFNLLRGNYRGYLTELNSFDYEKMMEEDKFLLKKAKLREYLEDFIKALLDESEEIKEIIIRLENDGEIEKILESVVRREFEKIELTNKVEYTQVKKRYGDQYNRLRGWFVTKEDEPSEVELLNRSTMNIIQKITKMAKQFLDKRKVSYSRKDSYLRVSKLISELEDIDRVKKLSSVIFGDFELYHLKAEYPEQVELEKIGEASDVVMRMKPIKERKKEKRSYEIKDRTKEKEASLMEEEKKRRDEVKNLEKYIHNERIILEELPAITSGVKNILINIIKAGLMKVSEDKRLAVRDDKLYYEYGETRYNAFVFKLFRPESEQDRTILETYDGNFEAPNFRIEFIREEKDIEQIREV